jgi:ribonuclease HII
MQRQHELLIHERRMRSLGFTRIAGIDEAGRGPLAGPVVAAACVIPEGLYIDGVDDSKKLTPAKRHALFEVLTTHPEIDFGIGIVEATIIDQINILQATLRAMIAAIAYLRQKPCCALVDGNQLPKLDIPTFGVVGGDRESQTIAAASIIAKETRDRIMFDLHKQWAHYGFDAHKGYGTREHIDAIKRFGPVPFIHRESFEPIKSMKQGVS